MYLPTKWQTLYPVYQPKSGRRVVVTGTTRRQRDNISARTDGLRKARTYERPAVTKPNGRDESINIPVSGDMRRRRRRRTADPLLRP